MPLKRIFITLLAALAFTAAAQYNDRGISIEQDEFEGTRRCAQAVSDQSSNVYVQVVLAAEEGLEHTMTITRTGLFEGGLIYPSTPPTAEDEVLIRFPSTDEVERLRVQYTHHRSFSTDRWQETVRVELTPALIRRITTTRGDLRFRLSPANGPHFDGTLPTGFLNEFSEFLEECL